MIPTNIFTFVAKLKNLNRYIVHFALLFGLLLLVHSCAREGMPSGGPKDETPPVFVKSKPAPNALNFNGKEVVISFDENVQLKDVFNNFIMSPPMEEDPVVKNVGNEIRVQLNNELQPNTTYTLYFGESVADYNEGNLLPDFTFSFSTGDKIDSLMMSGVVLDARTLNPVKGAIVGVYINKHDTAVVKNVPKRIAQTNSEGRFSIKNLPDSLFHIFSWVDVDRDYRYNPGAETFAYLDTILQPWFDSIQVADTLWADTLTIDTIIMRDTLVYLPDNLVMFTFQTERFIQSLKKKTRVNQRSLLFEFASSIDSLPQLALVDSVAENWYQFEPSITGDSLTVWLTDSTIIYQDTLNISLTYQKTDSMSELYWQTDTVMLNFKKPKEAKGGRKQRNKDEEEKEFNPKPKVEVITFSTNIKSTLDVFRPLELSFPEPIDSINHDSIHVLEVVNDSTFKELKVKLVQDEKMPRRYRIKYAWDEEKMYVLKTDSMAFTSMYKGITDSYKKQFSIRGKEEFGEIILNLSQIKGSGFVELLNGSDQMVRTLPFKGNGKIKFNFVEAGEYYIRLFVDANQNGVWDTGNYLEKIQPERVYYYDSAITVKQNWTMEEDWNVMEKSIDKQKPDKLKEATNKKKK